VPTFVTSANLRLALDECFAIFALCVQRIEILLESLLENLRENVAQR
jgi:hypothetical protein